MRSSRKHHKIFNNENAVKLEEQRLWVWLLCQNESTKVVMGEWELKRIASRIVECIHHGLEIYPRLKNIKLVVEKVLTSNLLQLNMFDSFLPPKIVVATQELVVGVCTSLVETKHANYAIKLAAKHCILTTAINAMASSSLPWLECLVSTIKTYQKQ